METVQLNRDTLFEILLRTDYRTFNQLCLTNKQVNTICHDERFWQQKIVADFAQIKHLTRN